MWLRQARYRCLPVAPLCSIRPPAAVYCVSVGRTTIMQHVQGCSSRPYRDSMKARYNCLLDIIAPCRSLLAWESNGGYYRDLHVRKLIYGQNILMSTVSRVSLDGSIRFLAPQPRMGLEGRAVVSVYVRHHMPVELVSLSSNEAADSPKIKRTKQWLAATSTRKMRPQTLLRNLSNYI